MIEGLENWWRWWWGGIESTGIKCLAELQRCSWCMDVMVLGCILMMLMSGQWVFLLKSALHVNQSPLSVWACCRRVNLMRQVELKVDQQWIRHTEVHFYFPFPLSSYLLSLFPSTRAGKGVFSAMKLGKIKSSKEDHKKGGKATHKDARQGLFDPKFTILI